MAESRPSPLSQSVGVHTSKVHPQCPVCNLQHLAFTIGEATEASQGLEARSAPAELLPIAVWTAGAEVRDLADPALSRLAEKLQLPVSRVSAMVAMAHRQHGASVCRHGVVLDGRLCTVVVIEEEEPGPRPLVGLVNLCEIFEWESGLSKLPITDGILVETGLLEAEATVPMMSVEDLRKMEDWSTWNCQQQPSFVKSNRPWQHTIMISHRWSNALNAKPGNRERFEQIKSRALERVERELADSTNPRMKAKTADEVGIWIDYMMVPNDPEHRDCKECQVIKQRLIKQINALLTVCAVEAIDPTETDRGWILQEISLNPHSSDDDGAPKHRHRVRLMSGHTQCGKPEDERLLRCLEFVRLGQMPRVWPTVNAALLRRWREAGNQDESEREASDSLHRYARSFDLDCHRLKRAMAEQTQRIATSDSGARDCPFDLSEVLRGIDEQTQALRELDDAIHTDDAELSTLDDEIAALRGRLDDRAKSLTQRGRLQLAQSVKAAANVLQGSAPYPDSRALHSLGNPRLEEQLLSLRIECVRQLQLQQFVGVAMGLRAEVKHAAGLAGWVRLSEVTDALAGALFMGRLKSGRVKYQGATCPVTLEDHPRSHSDRFEFAGEVVRNGVSARSLEKAYHAWG